MDDDDDTQVYKDHGDALTIAYQSGYYDGKKAAQPAQKPVAWLYEGEYSSGSYSGNYFAWNVTMNKNATNAARKVKPLYTTPAQRPWVGIPEEDLKQGDESFFVAWREGARWADVYLKEKNNG
jgi:hypothetical protein